MTQFGIWNLEFGMRTAARISSGPNRCCAHAFQILNYAFFVMRSLVRIPNSKLRLCENPSYHARYPARLLVGERRVDRNLHCARGTPRAGRLELRAREE